VRPAARGRRTAVVAHVGPASAGDRFALGQYRHRRVVAVQALGRQHMGHQPLVQRPQHAAAGADLVGQVDRPSTASRALALGLAIERLMLVVLLEQDHRQRLGPAQPRGTTGERRRRLLDGLAVAA